MLLEPLEAEQFRADRLLFAPIRSPEQSHERTEAGIIQFRLLAPSARRDRPRQRSSLLNSRVIRRCANAAGAMG